MPQNSSPTTDLAKKLRTLDGYVGHIIFDQRLRLSDNSTVFDSELAFRMAKLLTENIEAENQPFNPVKSVSVVLGQSVFHSRYINSGFLILQLSRQESLIGVRRRLCSILGELHLLATEAEIPQNIKVTIVPPDAAISPKSSKKTLVPIALVLFLGLLVVVSLLWPPKSEPAPTTDKIQGTGKISSSHTGITPKGASHPLGLEFLPVTIAIRGTAPRVVQFSTYETTVGQYREFLKASGSNWKPPIAVTEDIPVMFVTLEEANAFCGWLSTRGGAVSNYRLPTDDEWSWAMGIGELETALTEGESDKSPSAKDGRVSGYPWGSQSSVPAAILSLPGLTNRTKQLIPVTETWQHASGLRGLEGNVREWVSTPYQSDSTLGVARGGSWGDSNLLEASSSTRATNNGRHVTIGFRVCYDLPSN